MSHYDDLDAPDLEPVASELRAGRPRLTALELDATKQRIRARAAAPARRRTTKGTFMKSRLGILLMLVAGMLLSTTGAGLAVSGLSGSAAEVQYGSGNDDDKGGGGNVLGEEESNSGSGGPSGGSAPEAAQNDLQPTRQVEAGADNGGEELPFTGFAAIPVLLGGIALLTTGLVLRRRSAEE